MKRKWLKKLLAGMLVASMCVTQVPYGVMNGAYVVYAEASNLLTNGSFEEELGAEWKLQCKAEGKNVTGSIVTYGVYEGTHSFEIVNNDTWSSEYQYPEVWLTQSIDHLQKGTYQLTIHGMGDGGSGAKAVVSGNAIDDASIDYKGWTENKEDWGTITHTFTLDKEVNDFEIGVCIPQLWTEPNKKYYIDDISLVAVASDNPSEDALTTAKNELQTLIDECMLLDDEIYTAETWTSFNTALSNAKAELENAGATIGSINTVTQSLTSAKTALAVVEGNYYEECYKEDFSNAQEPGWTSTWSESSDSIADMIDKEDDSHEDNKVWNLWTGIEQTVNSQKTISGLDEGIYRLSFVAVGNTKSAKVSASNMVGRPVKVNGWNEDNSTYEKTVVNGITVDSTGNLQITLGIDFWADGYCKIDDITLEKVVTLAEKISAEKTKLNALITECEGLSESLYTAETWSALQTSITAAKESGAKTENSDTVLAEIQDAMANLTNAKAALELKEKTFYLDIYSENYKDTTDTGWTSNWENTEVEITDAVKESEWKLWTKSAQGATFTKTFSGLEAGDYQFEFLATGAKMGDCTVKVGDISKAVTVSSSGATTVVDGVKLNAAGDLTVTLELNFNDEGWINLDDVKLLKVVDETTKRTEEKKRLDASISECEALDSTDYTEETWSVLQEKLVAAKAVSGKNMATIDEIMNAKTELLKAKKALKEVNNIFVQKIENLSDDFIRGIDISSYISVTDSGATFKDANGKVLTDSEFFKMLNASGVNYARIRVWNDPFDKDGNGYGGGNNDLKKAKIIGKLATDAGMKVLIDFHYSDWWADPDRQLEPKAWKGKTVEEKETLLYDYTKESLTELLAYGVDVAMVQVGNETNNGIAGVSGWDNMCKLFSAGSKAVREIANENKKEIQVAVHFTDPQTKNWYNQVAKELDSHNVDYDVFASSYYPDIHGTMENITNVLQKVATDYNKKVMVAETAWSWTTADGDGHSSGFDPGKSVDYAVSVQGQINELRDVMDAVNKISNNAGIGVFYWEPAWIPVQYAYDEDGKKVDSIVESNQKKWEQFGSGWASSYSQEYDPEHGQYYGGSVKDDQAFFDFEGNPLASLTTFKDVYTGVDGTKVILETVKDTTAEVRLETTNVASETDKIKAVLPKTVTGVYNNSTKKELPVVWDEEQVAKINAFGNFSISGVATCDANRTEKVICSLTILPNTILENSDFENGNANWKVEDAGKADIKWDDTPLRGEGAMHFWSSTPLDFTISQTVKAVDAGKYCASMQLQGGDGSEKDDIRVTIVNKTRNTSVSKNAFLSGHEKWQNPKTETIEVQAGDELELIVGVKCIAGAWGSIDDVFLYKIGELNNNNGGSDSGNNSGSTPTTPPTISNPDSSTNNKTETGVETKPDGSTVETTTETKPDGTKVETTTETATDGSKKETVVETKPDGTKVETVTETATDGSKVETKKESETNTAGKQVDVATVTKTDADGKIASVVEKSTISEVAENTKATVTVKKNGEGAVTSATATIAATVGGQKTTLSTDVVSQLKEAAGQSDVRVSLTAKNEEGKTLYTVKVDVKNLTAENELYIYKLDKKTGELVMVNSKSYKVDEDGSLDLSIKNKSTYELVSKEEAKTIEKQIKATIKVQNSSKDVKKGKTTKVTFDKKMNMNNVKDITYSTADKKIATVSKSGTVTAKTKGTVTVKVTVTLKNGSTKTVTMKIKVK